MGTSLVYLATIFSLPVREGKQRETDVGLPPSSCSMAALSPNNLHFAHCGFKIIARVITPTLKTPSALPGSQIEPAIVGTDMKPTSPRKSSCALPMVLP